MLNYLHWCQVNSSRLHWLISTEIFHHQSKTPKRCSSTLTTCSPISWTTTNFQGQETQERGHVHFTIRCSDGLSRKSEKHDEDKFSPLTQIVCINTFWNMKAQMESQVKVDLRGQSVARFKDTIFSTKFRCCTTFQKNCLCNFAPKSTGCSVLDHFLFSIPIECPTHLPNWKAAGLKGNNILKKIH